MKGFRRKEGSGTPGMDESVKEAVKKGTSASGRDTLTLEVLESVGINSKRARCFCISSGLSADVDASTMSQKDILQFLRPFQTLCRELT
jgi:hypothetical protein